MARLRHALARRGLIGAPHPSELESRTLRLLERFGVVPIGAEVKVAEGRYRVDVLIVPGLAVEVSGYVYHWSPEQLRSDAERHNRLVLEGIRLLVYTWRDITFDGERVGREILAAKREMTSAALGRRG
ncbi:MAG: hypothetical protein ACYC1D_03930 [Acidimicrobiales bacterium]